MSVECLCVKRVSRSVKGEGAVLKAFANAWPAQLRGPIAAKATFKADLIREKTVSADRVREKKHDQRQGSPQFLRHFIGPLSMLRHVRIALLCRA